MAINPETAKKVAEQFNFYRTRQEIGGYSVAVPKGTRIILGTVATVVKPTLDVKNSPNQDAFSGFKEKDLGKLIKVVQADPQQVEYLSTLI